MAVELDDSDAPFTEGPWECDRAKHEGITYHQIDATVYVDGNPYDPKRVTVADTLSRDESIDPATDRANARLIAHAPQLFTALQDLIQALNAILPDEEGCAWCEEPADGEGDVRHQAHCKMPSLEAVARDAREVLYETRYENDFELDQPE